MKLAQFNFELPSQLIAKHPTLHRPDARMMVVNRTTGKIKHTLFSNLPRFFRKEDLIVLNDAKVFPGFLYGYKEKTGAQIEVLLARELDPHRHLWDVIIHPARKIRIGNKLHFGNYAITSEVIDNTTSRGRTLKFDFQGKSEDLRQILAEIGLPPLPAALDRKPTAADKQRYQTVYAKNLGAMVAPDAGLHFTPYILKYLDLKDVLITTITHHTNIHTPTPLQVKDISRYTLSATHLCVPLQAALAVNQAIAKKKKVCAVGTCTLNTLEACISSDKLLNPADRWSNKFLYPPYTPQIPNALLTSFHLPESIPFINTVTFAGYDLTMKAYNLAVKEAYRFFVYGDALLVL